MTEKEAEKAEEPAPISALARAAAQDADSATEYEGELVPQPHGGAIYRRGPPKGAAANRSSMRAAKKQAQRLLGEAAPAAARKLIALTRSDDDRVAAVASEAILTRVLGKPGDTSQIPDAVSAEVDGVDLSLLTAEEQERLSAALAEVFELHALAKSRRLESTIDGKHHEID